MSCISVLVLCLAAAPLWEAMPFHFNGVDGALFPGAHPLAGAQAFTWEVVFRPEPGSAPDRMLLEIRVVGDRWRLDGFVKSETESRTLLDRNKLHPPDRWYTVAAVCDGREFRNYVNGELAGRRRVACGSARPRANLGGSTLQ